MVQSDTVKLKSEEKQLVIFSLNNEEFGVDISQIKEIIRMEDITNIPNSESYMKGVINLRGKIILVLSLAKRLNLEEKKVDKETRIVIIEQGENLLGVVVDNVKEVLRITNDKITKAPDLINKEINVDFLGGVCILNERLIILLNLTKLISDNELNELSKQEKEFIKT